MELYTVGLLIETVLKIEYSETRLIRTPRERNNNDYISLYVPLRDRANVT